MLDRVARSEARAVAAGKLHPDDVESNKVALYGVLAQALNPDDLREQALPVVENFSQLEQAGRTLLTRTAVAGFHDLDPQTKRVGEELITENNPLARARLHASGTASAFCAGRLVLGAKTGAGRITAGLRTISREVDEGGQVTENGVYQSSRVPRTVTMAHLYGLRDGEELHHEIWVTPQLDSGIVYARDVVGLDPNRGLTLYIHPELDDTTQYDQYGPQIGCPVNLVNGYVQAAHDLFARSALESGLIKVS